MGKASPPQAATTAELSFTPGPPPAPPTDVTAPPPAAVPYHTAPTRKYVDDDYVYDPADDGPEQEQAEEARPPVPICKWCARVLILTRVDRAVAQNVICSCGAKNPIDQTITACLDLRDEARAAGQVRHV
jgi:hypothetical protein